MSGLSRGGWRMDAVSTCISSGRSQSFAAAVARREAGLSVIELLLGLSLALCLALGVAPLWVSFQSLGVREGDQTVWSLQARVSVARFERDLRTAGAEACRFPAGAAVLQATSSQVVLLVRTGEATAPVIVEWEIVGGSIMRRRGPCPVTRPTAYAHALYTDNKTMLENVDTTRSRFSYCVGGVAASVPLSPADLALVDGVTLELQARAEPGIALARTKAQAQVGR